MAIVAYTGKVKIHRLQEKRVCMYRKRSPTQHATVLADLSRLGPTHFSLPRTDIQAAADVFYDHATALLDRHYPEKQITMTSSDPNYVTPYIKSALRRKSKIMRAGWVEEAGALAERIGDRIITQNTAYFRHERAHMNSKELWGKVKHFSRRGHGAADLNPPNIPAEKLNVHYAAISTDSSYVAQHLRTTVNAPHEYISEWEMFRVLDTLRHRATGPENFPA